MKTSRAGSRIALWSLVAALVQGCAAGGSATPAASGAIAADPQSAGDFAGTWLGSYVCAQGATGLRLTLRPVAPGLVEGTFEFFPLAENPDVPEGAFEMSGRGSGGRIVLTAGEWIRQPEGYLTVDLVGTLAEDSRTLTGTVDNSSCTTFAVTRAGSGPE